MLAGAVFYLHSERSQTPLLFSPPEMLSVLWERYKAEYVEEASGRTLDKQRDAITTSEGQSYSMLRAVWMGDKESFDRSWGWTQENLARPEDSLFSWAYGQRSNGSWGVLTETGGNNSATDADSDIALALIFAYSRWQDPAYLESARAILESLWEKGVVFIRGVPYLAANDIEKSSGSSEVLVNPSYFAPYAYRIFAEVDTDRPWRSLVGSSYALLERSLEPIPGESDASASLPPNWIALDRETGALRIPSNSSLDTNYGYEAMRIPWRLALDWQWFGEERARELLEKFSHLSREWEEGGRIYSVYARNGSPIEEYESAAMYGGAIGHFTVANPEAAKEVFEEKLLYLFSPGENAWHTRLSYWDDNWAWFGLGLYQELLPNLAEDLPASALNR